MSETSREKQPAGPLRSVHLLRHVPGKISLLSFFLSPLLQMSDPVIVPYFSVIQLHIFRNEKAGLVSKPCPKRSPSNGKG